MSDDKIPTIDVSEGVTVERDDAGNLRVTLPEEGDAHVRLQNLEAGVRLRGFPRLRSTPANPPTPPPVIPCAHCGARVNGQCAVFLHIGDNPPSGRPRVNVISQGFQFCGVACRDAWWSTATSDTLIPEHMHAEVASEHPLSATVFHCHDGNRDRVVMIETDDGATVAEQWGEVASQHAFVSHDHLEAWWRGEADADDLPILMAGEA